MHEIEKLDKKVQVILMSGVDPTYFKGLTKDDQRTEFLPKPFALESVVRLLKAREKNAVNKVLVVDDQDLLREMLKDFLTHEGYEIMEARNGKECIDCTKSHQFDAIFMDVRMPEMDGLAALHNLRERGIQTPVFLMSGFGEVASVEDAQKQGAQNFLPKPFKLEKALEMLNTNDG
jgi:DNA-binding NtrC family response regulator